jgi:hypothetical protein
VLPSSQVLKYPSNRKPCGVAQKEKGEKNYDIGYVWMPQNDLGL